MNYTSGDAGWGVEDDDEPILGTTNNSISDMRQQQQRMLQGNDFIYCFVTRIGSDYISYR